MNRDVRSFPMRVLLVVFFASGCSTSSPLPRLDQVEKSLAEPMVLELLPENRPVVLVQFPGTTEIGDAGVPMIVDSGAAITVLSKSFAEELGLYVALFDGEGKAYGSGGGTAALTHYAAIDHLRVGDVNARGFHVAVVDSVAIDEENFVGILGQDLFGAFATLIDMVGRELHFLPASFRQEEISTYLSNETNFGGDWYITPAKYEPLPFMDFSYTVDGQKHDFSLGLDTGAVGTSMPLELCEALELESTGGGTRTGIDGLFEVTEYALNDLGIGSFQVSLDVAERKSEYGMLGMDVLSKFVMILDSPTERVWLLLQEQSSADDE
ncbi:MAG: putative aspartyl protease [Planctomycetota bacterium]|jgi:predicted aspartyl protease